jgi:hypothetical protein
MSYHACIRPRNCFAVAHQVTVITTDRIFSQSILNNSEIFSQLIQWMDNRSSVRWPHYMHFRQVHETTTNNLLHCRNNYTVKAMWCTHKPIISAPMAPVVWLEASQSSGEHISGWQRFRSMHQDTNWKLNYAVATSTNRQKFYQPTVVVGSQHFPHWPIYTLNNVTYVINGHKWKLRNGAQRITWYRSWHWFIACCIAFPQPVFRARMPGTSPAPPAECISTQSKTDAPWTGSRAAQGAPLASSMVAAAAVDD